MSEGNLMIQSRQLITPAVWFFYLAIVFEFLFMITPFALYFYTAYRPGLSLLNDSPLTAWLTGFFLPHFSQTSSTLLATLNSAGWALAYLGLSLFLFSAVQLYGSKLLRRGAVTGFLYKYVRHPQYLALALLGLGMTLIWPRFIVLLTFVSMLFVYRMLARTEEQNCVRKYGAAYEEYQARTGMFLPPLVPGKLGHHFRIGLLRPPWRGLTMYVAAIAVAVLIGAVLREHTLRSVAAVYQEEAAIVSPAMLPEEHLLEVYGLAAQAPGLEQRIQVADAPLLVYVVPRDWYLPDLPLDSHEVVRRRGGHGTPARFNRIHYRVLFTSIRSHTQQPRGRDILRKAYAIEPLVLVEVDMRSGRIVGQSEPPGSVIWGQISSPLL